LSRVNDGDGHECNSSNNESLTEHGENSTDDANSRGSSSVSDGQVERGLGCWAEVLVSQGDLDVGLFVHKLDAAIKGPGDESNAGLDSFPNSVCFWLGLLILVNDILENKSDNSYNRDEE